MVLQHDTRACPKQEPVSSFLIQTLGSAFGLLAALSIRDLILQLITLISPDQSQTKLAFSCFVTVMFIMIAVMITYYFQDRL
jgi:hypothetical protein